MNFDRLFDQFGDQIVSATWTTVSLALLSFVVAMVTGIIIVSFRVSPIPPLAKFASWFVSFFRNEPLIVVFFLAFFALGEVGLVFDPFPTAVAALGLYTGAYMAEVLRSGINSVGTGQIEAGRALGLSFIPLMSLIVVPQAVRTVIGPIGNLFVANFKNTSIALTISVVELTAVSSRMFNASIGTWTVLFVIAGLYLLFLLPVGWVFRQLENRYAIKR